MAAYFVYILANGHGTLYVGVTNDLLRRLDEHRQGSVPGFSQRYNVTRLVYVEATGNIAAAIVREKQLKGWRKEKKVELVETMNPGWKDLSEEWKLGWHPSRESSGSLVDDSSG